MNGYVMRMYGEDVTSTAALLIAIQVCREVLVRACGSSPSMRFMSWENNLVMTPVFVLEKKRSGAERSVHNAASCRRVPEVRMMMSMPMAASAISVIKAGHWNRA